MKSKLILFVFIISNTIFAQQSINDYAGVVVPIKFDFLKSINEYRLSTYTKFNLEKAGFKAVYANPDISNEFPDRCSLLTVDVIKDSGFLVTKLYVEFKDCSGTVVYTSEVGKSREKDFAAAYIEALANAFESINKLGYKYSGKTIVATNAVPTKVVTAIVPEQSAPVSSVVSNSNQEILYAQPTETGFQLIDKTPKVVMKLMKTGTPNSFIAIKGDVQGVLNLKDNQWFFDSYQNGTLVSEVIAVKF